MMELTWLQYALIGLVFIWSGFVRSGLGFGGAVLSLPFLLLIDNSPLVYLPIIAVHLLVFSSATVIASYFSNKHKLVNPDNPQQSNVDWQYLRYAFSIIIIPKLIGVLGILNMPTDVMSALIFIIVSCYAISYIINKPFVSRSKTLDIIFLMLGGYISGTSLIGAPLIIAVIANHVNKYQLRNTLFVLWFVLVVIKMSMFVYMGVDLQLIHHLWLLPCAGIGHVIGLFFHKRLIEGDQSHFYRILGVALLVISILGIYQLFS